MPDTWMACLARRARRLSTVTRWMVCMAMMLCVFSMLFICLAIMRTAPRQRILGARATHASAMPFKVVVVIIILYYYYIICYDYDYVGYK